MIVREEKCLANSVAARLFDEKCVDVLPSGCRIWMGATNEHGYGSLRAFGRHYRAHRAAWEIHHGSPPKGNVLHRCDVSSCVNPDHLFVGTQADNMRDMHSKGRAGKCGAKGEKQGSSKLKVSDIKEIRRLSSSGVTQREIAEKFGITRSNVSIIVRRKGWSHV